MSSEKINIYQLDVCYCDYFSGHSLPTLAIPIYGKGIRKYELLQAIEDELCQVWDMFEFAGYSENDLNSAIVNFKESLSDSHNFATIIENEYFEPIEDEYSEPIYAYFVVGYLQEYSPYPVILAAEINFPNV